LEHYADAAIPSDVKQWFQTDDQGKVVWFTAPPGNLVEPKRGLEHSAKYLAWRVKQDEQVARLRRERELEEAEKRERERERDEARRKSGEARKEAGPDIEELKRRAVKMFEEQLSDVLVLDYKRRFGENWKEAADAELRRLQELQVDEAKAREEVGKVQRENLRG
jgi:chromatin structure-remodeling complex subunit RSC1/2